MLPLKRRFRESQIVITTNFVVVIECRKKKNCLYPYKSISDHAGNGLFCFALSLNINATGYDDSFVDVRDVKSHTHTHTHTHTLVKARFNHLPNYIISIIFTTTYTI